MANYRFFVDYAAHFLSAKTRHGIHSPFVYRLIDEVIYEYSIKDYEQEAEALRAGLLADERMITVVDLGAGSMLNKRNEKKIGDIAKNALKPARIAKLLARLAAFSKPNTIVELGTCLGVTSTYLAKACPGARVISVEGCPSTAKIAKENFEKMGLDAIDLRVGNFDVLLPQIIEELPSIDFLFIDGNHRKQATLDYFYACLDKVNEESLLIFDDIYWSQGMKEAWEEIKTHPDVMVSIDLFYIGLVFFKKDRRKENFKVRFR